MGHESTRSSTGAPRSAPGFVVPAPVWPVDDARREGWYGYQVELEALERGRVRDREGHEMLMLGSYSYLGLNGHPLIDGAAIEAVRRHGTGTNGVRLLSGTLPLHRELEAAVSRFKGCEAAAVFTSGFLTNVSVISALVRPGDAVFSDKLDHASIVDGCRLSGARIVRVRHNDMRDLERKLSSAEPCRNKLVVADAVFSMDGDVYDLPRAMKLCRRHGAMLMIDEAHSLGVLGATGRGIEEHFGLLADSYDVKIGTFSKAIPSCGGYVAGAREVVDVIQHNGRGFVYSAALPPAQAAAALAALRILEAEPWRVRTLQRNVAHFRAALSARDVTMAGTTTPIVPVICGSDETAWAVAQECRERGVFVQAIPSPVVPVGTARLRCCVTATHAKSDLETCADVIAAACRRQGVAVAREQRVCSRVGGPIDG